MADKIQSYYLRAGEIGGLDARAKLSMLTKVDSFSASSLPDSDENIKIFEEAMDKIVNEFNEESSTWNTLRLKILNLLMD